MYSNEFVIPKGVIHLGEKFVREVQPLGFAVLGGHQGLGISNSYCTPPKF